MNRQCKCTDCGYVFDIEDAGGVRENHWLDGEYMGSETFLVCPNCGGDFEDSSDCCECGEAFTEDELYSGWCEKCLREAINYETFLEYCEANKAHQYLDVFVMFEILGGMGCPENVSSEFHDLMLSAYKGRAKASQEYAKIFGRKENDCLLERCVRFIMEDDGDVGRYNFAEWLNKREVK